MHGLLIFRLELQALSLYSFCTAIQPGMVKLIENIFLETSNCKINDFSFVFSVLIEVSVSSCFCLSCSVHVVF